MKFGIVLTLCMVFAVTSFAFPHTRRQQTSSTIDPFLFGVRPDTPKDVSAASLKTVCDSLATTLKKTLADCGAANKGTDTCNKPNGNPIDANVVDKHTKQCEAHGIDSNGLYDPNIFGNQLSAITQTGNTFTVGQESFQTEADAIVGACKQQRKQNLATLADCEADPANAAKCNKLDGTPVTRTEINLHNS
ncbi:9261_t:CDS:1, partial [Ambispora gerdemannii]